MKRLLMFLMVCSLSAAAQRTPGLVLNNVTRQPIGGASILLFGITGNADEHGRFSVQLNEKANIITVSAVGFKSYYYIADDLPKGDTIKVYLNPLVYRIDEVSIMGSNYKSDSLATRRDFKQAFNYEGLNLKDALVSRSAAERFSRNPAPNSTSQILSLNVLNIIGLIGKGKDKSTRFQQRLVKEEGMRFTDSRFSKTRITSLTGLKGDSLNLFMVKYRPEDLKARNMTEYELVKYIKDKFKEFANK